MNEALWFTCQNPTPMLIFLRDTASNRKFQLFESACQRRIPAKASIRWEQLRRGSHPPAVWVMDPNERKELIRAILAVEKAIAMVTCTTRRKAEKQAVSAIEWEAQCNLLRDIFGNPFRPIFIQPNWLTPTITNLATVAYDERILPSGEFDTARLATLADALEDEGCDYAEILGHLRSPRPHVRGCHVLDLLLGKE